MAISSLDHLMQLLAKLPGLGPRSARRTVLYLLKRRETLLTPLISALSRVALEVHPCRECGNLSTEDPCSICYSQNRDRSVLCVIEDVADLWAIERSHAFRGLYHVLGGTLSALEGVRPQDLKIDHLLERINANHIKEVILALNATVEGQATVHYVTERLAPLGVSVTRLAHGLPVGGELDYLDDGTLMAAIKARRQASQAS